MSVNNKPYIHVYSNAGKITELCRIHLAVTQHGLAMLRYSITQKSFITTLKHKFRGSKISVNPGTHIIIRQIDEYLQGARKQFFHNLDLRNCSKFQRLVLKQVLHIPYGQTTTYQSIGQSIGNPKASRAIGVALANNPLPIVVPCHRVIHANGNIGGYLGSPHNNTKIYLLQLETNLMDK